MRGWEDLSRDELANILGYLPIRQRLLVMRVSRATHNAGTTTPTCPDCRQNGGWFDCCEEEEESEEEEEEEEEEAEMEVVEQ